MHDSNDPGRPGRAAEDGPQLGEPLPAGMPAFRLPDHAACLAMIVLAAVAAWVLVVGAFYALWRCLA